MSPSLASRLAGCLVLFAAYSASLATGKEAVRKPASTASGADVSENQTTDANEATANEAAEAAAKAEPKAAGGVALDPALDLLNPRTYQMKIVVRIEAPAESACKNIVFTAPIPMDWPEQKVRLLNRKFTAGGKYRETTKKGQCRMMKYQIPRLAAGEAASVELLYEITRWQMRFAAPVETLDFPHGPPPDVRDQFIGLAPGLEMKHPKIVGLASDLAKQHEDDKAWDLVKGFWQWTRDNVAFKNGDFRGALFAIEQQCGDCEEMSALFVSMCRLSNVVARSVWVEGHNYPEFYLVDSRGKGHWIPAQVVGPPWFGEMTEYRPILQKGDRFYDPFKKQYVRYTPQTAKADGAAEPKFTVDHRILADSDINGPTYENSK